MGSCQVIPQGLVALSSERLAEAATTVATGLAFPFIAVLVIGLLERRAGKDMSRYRSREFAVDVVYMLFYRGKFYSFFVSATLTAAVEPFVVSFRVDLFDGITWPIGFAVFWIGGDFLTYWWHRWQHSSRLLWAFHTIHHSQEKLTIFTGSRRHVIENALMDILVYFLVFEAILGIPTRAWEPALVFLGLIITLQHSQLDWGYGPFYRVFVSPRFHAFHHSVQPEHLNRNYGFIFSTWDFLFGTAISDQPRPTEFGLRGIVVEDTVRGQLLGPFRLLGGRAALSPGDRQRSDTDSGAAE